LCELAAENVGRDEVRENLFAVDLEDGNQLPVSGLQLRIAVDGDLFQLEAELSPKPGDRRPRPLTEVAAVGAVETDYG
jgi:hypothetical protein